MPFLADLSGSAVDHYFRRLLEDYLKDKEQLKCGAAFTLTHAHTHAHTHASGRSNLWHIICIATRAVPHLRYPSAGCQRVPLDKSNAVLVPVISCREQGRWAQ